MLPQRQKKHYNAAQGAACIYSKKFRTGPFEQTPQDLKRAARARPPKEEFFLHFGARARRVLGLEGSVQKVLFEIS